MTTGAELHEEINKRITGRLALISPAESELLYKYASLDSDYLEIGCLWGGTAILAALAKINNGATGHVYTIDYMKGGYWDRGDPGAGNNKPTLAKVEKNLKRFDVDHRVTILVQSSNPLNLPETVMPRVVLIDGGHSYRSCKEDWENVRAIEPDFVLFHDYDTERHPGVVRVVDEILGNDSQYKKIEQVDTLIVIGKRKAA